MFETNPELCLLAHLFDDVYKTSSLSKPASVNWARFEHIVHINKLPLLAYTSVLEDPGLDIPAEWRARFQDLKEHQEEEKQKVAPSIEQVNLLLGDIPYVLVKTYRPYLYFTHDLDILVPDPAVVGELVTKAGIPWDDIPRGSVEILEPQWLDLEFYRRVMAGSIQVIDDELTLRNPVPMTMQGVPTHVASPAIEVVTLIADAIFRLYELKLGDMIYIFTLAEQTDWNVLREQAIKYGWLRPFEETVGVLNGFHRELYCGPSPIEAYIPRVKSVKPIAPYVPGWITTSRALSAKGKSHLLKLPAYFSVLLKQNHETLHRLYVRWIQVPIGRLVLRYLYK